jgi:hypothetical protein
MYYIPSNSNDGGDSLNPVGPTGTILNLRCSGGGA